MLFSFVDFEMLLGNLLLAYLKFYSMILNNVFLKIRGGVERKEKKKKVAQRAVFFFSEIKTLPKKFNTN